MNIILTGAFGFVGANLSQILRTPLNHSVIAIDLANPGNSDYDKFYSWDELGKVDWDKIDVIIHLAGKAHDTKNTTEEKDYFDINVGLTKKIFDYYLKSSATKFIYFSSVKAVADSVKGDYLREEAEPNPGTAYGRSKLEAEKVILERMSDNLPNERTILVSV